MHDRLFYKYGLGCYYMPVGACLWSAEWNMEWNEATVQNGVPMLK